MDPTGPRPGTTCVHAGEHGDAPTGAVNVPIHRSSTFRHPEHPDGSANALIYSRYDNPTVTAVEEKTAQLEGAAGALLFASGMAAIDAVLSHHLHPGDAVAVQHALYGGTAAYLHDELGPLGIRVHPIDATRPGRLPAGTRLVWLESISNPLLRVADIPGWAQTAHDADALLAVDATFATPILQRPLALGADLVVHSASKYLGGHCDLIGGALAFRDPTMRAGLWTRRRNRGGILDPDAAYLLGRGIKTLHVRMERHTHNAHALAASLADDSRIRHIHHPGLPSHPDHGRARRLLPHGTGGMLTLDLGSLEAAQAFRRATRLFLPAASLGGVESLVSLPLETSHAYADAEERRAQGITDGLVRLSVGIEDLDDLREDMERGLAAAARSTQAAPQA